jgi:hypothetical protein
MKIMVDGKQLPDILVPVAVAMLVEAECEYYPIEPCGKQRSLEECFTINGDRLVLWFNTTDESTRVITKKISWPPEAL